MNRAIRIAGIPALAVSVLGLLSKPGLSAGGSGAVRPDPAWLLDSLLSTAR